MIGTIAIGELKRIATNSYDGDKRFMNSVIREISLMMEENSRLKIENANLKQKLESTN